MLSLHKNTRKLIIDRFLTSCSLFLTMYTKTEIRTITLHVTCYDLIFYNNNTLIINNIHYNDIINITMLLLDR